MQAVSHQKIDQIFDTNQAPLYTAESKATQQSWDEYLGKQTAIIPPPTVLSLAALSKAGRLAKTSVSSVKGWKVGQPTNNRTAFGRIPKWSTVRRRHWKNKAFDHKNGKVFEELEYQVTEENIARMEKGLAPRFYDKDLNKWESVELHHNPPQRDGGLFDFVEVTPQIHEKMDRCRNLGKK